MNKVYAWLGGRTTAFALGYMVCGIILAFKHELTPVYVTLGTPVLAMLGKSVSDNYHARKNVAGGAGGAGGTQSGDQSRTQSTSAAQTASSPPPA
jgi:hypothetical protein